MVTFRLEADDAARDLKRIPFLATVRYWESLAHKTLNDIAPSHVLCFNGRQAAYASFLNKSAATGIPCYIHERNSEYGSYIIKLNEAAHKRYQLQKLLERLSLEKLSDAQKAYARQWASNFYQERYNGRNLDCVNYIKGSHAESGRQGTQITIFLTSTDEISPTDSEFNTVSKQWILAPKIVRWIRSSWPQSLNQLPIVIRLHPNMIFRNGASIHRLSDKINKLSESVNGFNATIDTKPQDESTLSTIIKSKAVVTLASSAALEAEYYGVPSVVPSRHIYSFAASNSFDFDSLLKRGSQTTPFILNSHIDASRLALFSYLFYHIQALRFDSVSFTGYNDYEYDGRKVDHSKDMNFLLECLRAEVCPSLTKVDNFIDGQNA
jgi:hypothetical protein